MWAWWIGEKLDSETKISHLAHAGADIMFLLGAELDSLQLEHHPINKKNSGVKRGKRKQRSTRKSKR